MPQVRVLPGTPKYKMNEQALTELISRAKLELSEVDFHRIIHKIDLKCRRCGQCCIIPAIPKINKPANIRCQYLTEGKACSVYDDFSIRPRGCAAWPVLGSKEFMLGKPTNTIIWGYNICPIIQEFWHKICDELKEEKGTTTSACAPFIDSCGLGRRG